MEIPGMIFIVVGVIVSLVSKRAGMDLFFYTGAGFILWGIIKIAKNSLTKKLLGSSKIEPKNEYKRYNNNQQQPDNVVSCSKCGLRHYSSANYCQNCGTKLK